MNRIRDKIFFIVCILVGALGLLGPIIDNDVYNIFYYIVFGCFIVFAIVCLVIAIKRRKK